MQLKDQRALATSPPARQCSDRLAAFRRRHPRTTKADAAIAAVAGSGTREHRGERPRAVGAVERRLEQHKVGVVVAEVAVQVAAASAWLA